MAEEQPRLFRGGAQGRRDAHFGIGSADFWRWWHRVGKAQLGEGDLATRQRAVEIYDEWRAQGCPKVK